MRSDAYAAVCHDPRTQAAAKAPYLDEARELELLGQARNGDREAVSTLVDAHMRMVVRTAVQFYRPGLAVQDLVSEGVLGLLVAIERFDPQHERRLSTYAAWWIRAQISRYAQGNRSVVTPPSTRGARLARGRAGYVARDLLQRLQRQPTHEEIASELGVSESDVSAVERTRDQCDLSLSVDDRGSPIDLRDGEAGNPEELLSMHQEKACLQLRVQNAVAELRPRDRSIVEQTLLTEEPKEMAEIGRALGTSRQRVSQILRRVRRELEDRLGQPAS